MAPCIINNHRVPYAMLPEFPGGQTRSLVSGTGLVDPDMNRNPFIEGCVDRRCRGPKIHERKPTGVTVRQHIDSLSTLTATDFTNK